MTTLKPDKRHTPGPWTVDAHGNVNGTGNGQFPPLVARMHGNEMVPPVRNQRYSRRRFGDQDKANALLIAAAPDLLGAAKALLDDVRRRYPGEELRCPLMRALDAAVAKAVAFDEQQDKP